MKYATILNAIICEDIRQEVSGKFSLAGVYGSGVNVTNLPATMIMGVFAEVSFHLIGEFEPQFRVIDDAGAISITGNMKLSVNNLDTFPLVLGAFPISVTGPGEVKFQWKFPHSAWQTIKSFKVVHNPNAPLPTLLTLPNAVPPPSLQSPPVAPGS